MIRNCVICGAPFRCHPSDKKVTCCHTCSIERKRQSHRGVSNRWSDEARARRRAEEHPELRRGTAAALKLSGGQRGPQNRGAKIWILEDPFGHEHRVVNLLDWARLNSYLFERRPDDGTPKRVLAGFEAIRRSRAGKLAYRVESYKGWHLLEVRDKKGTR